MDLVNTRAQSPVATFRFARLGALANLVHAISLRGGGVSPIPFASLNVSFSVGDDPDRVRENRRRLLRAVELEPTGVICAGLAHGRRVSVVGRAEAGRGVDDPATVIPESDGLITAEPGVALWMTFADCVPVLLHDPVRRVVGLAHAGWRGTLLRTAAATVEAMRDACGSSLADILAGIGPSIGPCCYEVGSDVADAFVASWGDAAPLRELDSRAGESQRWHLDLWGANRRALVFAGVPEASIEVAGRCTACDTASFFSHRAEQGRTGRFAAVIGLVRASA